MQHLLESIKQFANLNFIPVMQDETRELLACTVGKLHPKSILEIGTAIGFSGIVMLSESPNAVLNTIEMNENSLALAKENFKSANLLNRVNFFVGDVRKLIVKLTGKYDFIFLDGPKGQYATFLPYLFDLLNVGGKLFADNVFYKGLVESLPHQRHKHITIARNLNKFLQDLKDDKRFETELFHIGDGVSVSTKLKEK